MAASGSRRAQAMSAFSAARRSLGSAAVQKAAMSFGICLSVASSVNAWNAAVRTAGAAAARCSARAGAARGVLRKAATPSRRVRAASSAGRRASAFTIRESVLVSASLIRLMRAASASASSVCPSSAIRASASSASPRSPSPAAAASREGASTPSFSAARTTGAPARFLAWTRACTTARRPCGSSAFIKASPRRFNSLSGSWAVRRAAVPRHSSEAWFNAAGSSVCARSGSAAMRAQKAASRMWSAWRVSSESRA
ncbi:MAG: hypothetical protein BWX69_03256 [Planctomycetes bacterium ADurb.Bin069]|nr:MAG: hypothetical protein BWX69_03256 [Planctomycetes bacterium ADurb.Bin069]